MVLVYPKKFYGEIMFRYVRRLARRIRRHDASRRVQEQFAEERTLEPIPELDSTSDAPRLEEEERYQTRPRTTRLSEQSERVGKKYQEIPDPWGE